MKATAQSFLALATGPHVPALTNAAFWQLGFTAYYEADTLDEITSQWERRYSRPPPADTVYLVNGRLRAGVRP